VAKVDSIQPFRAVAGTEGQPAIRGRKMSGVFQSGVTGAVSARQFTMPQELLRDLYQRSGAGQFGIAQPEFATILSEIAQKYSTPGDSDEMVRELLSGLKLEELVLARACAAGHERAWEKFLVRFREKLYDAARGIARDDASAKELADSLYADLYGTTTREGKRVSKLASYMGRGSLEGWLRMVLSQEFVDRYRRGKRLVSLDEKEEEEGAQFAQPASEPVVAIDPRLEAATGEALAGLSGEDRFILASYYLDGRKLADVARTLRVHESTISRRVEKIAAGLRKAILKGLMKSGMSRRQADEALQADVRDLQVNVRQHLAQESLPRSFPAAEEARAPREES